MGLNPKDTGLMCPKCGQQGTLTLNGSSRGKPAFHCQSCHKQTLSSHNLPKRPCFSDFVCPHCQLRGTMFFNEVREDGRKTFRCKSCKKVVLSSYKLLPPKIYADFTCPKCLTPGQIIGSGKNKKGIQQFKCTNCQKRTSASCSLYERRKYRDFVCPKCGEPGSMVTAGGITGRDKSKKKIFRCKKCQQITMESCTLHKSVNLLTPFSPKSIKPFNFDDDTWDTRGMIELDDSPKSYGLNFAQVKIDFLKLLSKRYVLHCLRTGVSVGKLQYFLRVVSIFSDYLEMNYNITSIEEITRKIILGFMGQISLNLSSETIRHHLSSLRGFFDTGNLLGWFNVSEHLIRTEDYPKAKRGTPHDIPTIVLNQIEENLHKLPDSIARMWLVGFFCAMRISELQLCKQDCLKQDSRGQWFIEFWRKKNKDTHRLPITLERAKIIQEQQEYIQQTFGDSFDYLFCDFYKAFKTADTLKVYNQPMPKPVRSIVLSESINTLIKAEDIRDENGKLWKFVNQQLRDTSLTYLFETGHEMAVISKWAGHRHLRTTQKYVRVKDKTVREETFKIQAKMVNFRGEPVEMKALPNTLQENPKVHTLAYDDHINTPIYGYCGLPLDQDCPHWKACYTCPSFVARREQLPDYIRVRDLLREKQARAEQKGQTAMVDQFKQQADSLEAIIVSFEEKSA